jgi:hypothetical protein
MRGYLYKYKAFNLGLFSNEWEQRYFTLCGSTLTYYKSEHDLAFAPRGQVDVKVRCRGPDQPAPAAPRAWPAPAGVAGAAARCSARSPPRA